MLTIGNVLN